jgi:hypothetical protein
VTQFFRDPDAFETLKRIALTPLVSSKAAGEPIRIWVSTASSSRLQTSRPTSVCSEPGNNQNAGHLASTLCRVVYHDFSVSEASGRLKSGATPTASKGKCWGLLNTSLEAV